MVSQVSKARVADCGDGETKRKGTVVSGVKNGVRLLLQAGNSVARGRRPRSFNEIATGMAKRAAEGMDERRALHGSTHTADQLLKSIHGR